MKLLIILLIMKGLALIFDVYQNVKQKKEQQALQEDKRKEVEIRTVNVYATPSKHIHITRKEVMERRRREFDVWRSNCNEVHQVLNRLRPNQI